MKKQCDWRVLLSLSAAPWCGLFLASSTFAAGERSSNVTDLLPPGMPVKPKSPVPIRGTGLFPEGEEDPRQRDPLGSIAHDMADVASDLSDNQTGKPTQLKQKAIVAQLDKLIEQLDKQCNSSGNGSGSRSPSKPMNDSKLTGGPGGMGELGTPRSAGRDWGQISPKERERIQRSQTEGFPPGYESVLESYFRRLSEEKRAGGE